MNNTPFPPEIEELILKRQVEAGNKADITVFYKDPWAAANYGGIDWGKPETCEFWKQILVKRNYKPFYDKYPQTEYKGKIAGYPKEIVNLALKRLAPNALIDGKSKLQCLEENGIVGSIDWYETPEGLDFWDDINCKNFETFYKLYPGTQTLTNNEESRNSKDESSTIIDREQRSEGIACYRTPNQPGKVAIASKLVGDTAQNRVTKGRFAKCEISFTPGFQ